MKLLDLQEKRLAANNLYMAYFMEGDAPTQAQLDAIDIQKVINDCLFAMPYNCGQYGTGGKMIMQPMNRADQSMMWPLHSSWQQVDTVYGTQVIPKTSINRNRDLSANSDRPAQQVSLMLAMEMMGRVVAAQSALYTWLSGVSYYTAKYNPADATQIIAAEYDFGADVELTGIMRSANTTGATANPLVNGKLQAQIGGVWTDVTAVIGRGVGGADPAIVPILNGKTTARYFRIVCTSTTLYLFAFGMRFFGKYVSGNPRTYQKMGHMILVPIGMNSGTFNIVTVAETGATCNVQLPAENSLMDDRQVAASAYTLTDDPKQVTTKDLFIPTGLAFEQGSSLYPPFFTTLLPITELGAL